MVVDRFKQWISVLKPEGLDSFIKANMGKENLRDAFINFLIIATIGSVLLGLLMALYVFVFGALLSSLLRTIDLTAMFGSLFVFGIISVISIFVLSLITQFLSSGFYWILAKALGGKATYARQTYVLSYLSGGFQLVGVALMFISWIPCVGSLVSMAYLVYYLYMQYMMIKNVHEMSSARAAAVVLIPIVITLIIVAALYFFYFASLLLVPRTSSYYY